MVGARLGLCGIVLAAMTSAIALGWADVCSAQDARVKEEGERGWLDVLASGRAWVKLRYRFEEVDQDGFAANAHASTLRTVLGYETKTWHRLSALVEFENVTAVGNDLYDSTTNGETSRPVVADPEDTEVNQAYLQWSGVEDLTARVGRRVITLDDHRFVGDAGWRQNQQTFDALTLEYARIPRTKLFYAFLDNVNRVAGRVEKLYADYTGVEVSKGDHLVDIYSPELVVAQEEFLVGLRALGGAAGKPTDERDRTRYELARQKLLLLGVTDEQVAELEKTGQPQLILTMHAPIGGTVVEKSVREGAYVETGEPLYSIADLSRVWVLAEVYEFELPWVVRGQKADVTVEALPGEAFEGTVAFVDPHVDDATRTVKVRINLDNSRRLLKPGMFADVRIHAVLGPDGKRTPSPLAGKYSCPMHPEILVDDTGQCPICGMTLVREPGEVQPAATGLLAIPTSAVLDSGARRIVWVEREPGKYEVAEVVLGPRAGDRYAVLSGLSEGQRVVVRGNFLLDSQSQIEGKPSLLFPDGLAVSAGEHAGHSDHSGH